MVVPVDSDSAGRGRAALQDLAGVLGDFDGLAIALNATVDCTDRDQVWFHLLANIDPIGDAVSVGDGLGLDATIKRDIDATAQRPVRAWPDPLPIR